MVRDPFQEHDWGDYSSLFLFRLYYDDRDLEIDQCARSNVRPNGYAVVLTYDFGKVRKIDGCIGRDCCPAGRPR